MITNHFQVIMPTLRPSAKSSTSALLTARVALPSTLSSAPMEPSSTRTTSFAIGGSTLTAQKLRASTPWTKRSLPNAKPPPPTMLQTAAPSPTMVLPLLLQPHLELRLLLLPHLLQPQLLITMKKRLPLPPPPETTTELPLPELTSPLEPTKPRLPRRSARAALSVEDGNSRVGGSSRLFAVRASRAVAADSSNSEDKKLNF